MRSKNMRLSSYLLLCSEWLHVVTVKVIHKAMHMRHIFHNERSFGWLNSTLQWTQNKTNKQDKSIKRKWVCQSECPRFTDTKQDLTWGNAVLCLRYCWRNFLPLTERFILDFNRLWGSHLGPVARSIVNANHKLRSIESFTFLWSLTLVSAYHASSNCN